jgi:hypothetical protein
VPDPASDDLPIAAMVVAIELHRVADRRLAIQNDLSHRQQKAPCRIDVRNVCA